MSLPRRSLGNTGLQLSVIGYGASALGSVFENINEEEGIQSVHEAFRLGVNYFDTSPFYGSTKSETVLGKALRGLPRDEIVVSSKVGRYGAEVFDFSAERVTASVHESLARLQLSHLDLVLCHDIEFANLDQVVNETLPALAALKQRGVVRFIGFSGLPLYVFPYVLDRAPPGLVDVVLSYCHSCLNDTTLDALLPHLGSKGVGVINASALAMGLLTQAGPPAWHPAPPEVKEACAAAAAYCSSQSQDLARLALLFTLRRPGVATTLVSMPTPQLVRANVAAARQALGVDAHDNATGDALATQQVLRILEPVQGVTWPSGRPENNQSLQ